MACDIQHRNRQERPSATDLSKKGRGLTFSSRARVVPKRPHPATQSQHTNINGFHHTTQLNRQTATRSQLVRHGLREILPAHRCGLLSAINSFLSAASVWRRRSAISLKEHASGNHRSKFTLEIETPSTVVRVDVMEAESAVLPSATYSVHDRPSRQVGHLGYFNLVTASDGAFVSLSVNSNTGQVRGVIKQFDGDWINVDDSEIDNIDSAERFLEYSSTRYANHHRGLQAFHSNYLYQIDLHLDFDYELVSMNGGTLCNTFGYINSLVTAANAVFEKEIMTHINVKSMKQTDLYDQAKAADEVIMIMKEEYAKVQGEGIDLHYALLGKN
jgi:hypothetical protein